MSALVNTVAQAYLFDVDYNGMKLKLERNHTLAILDLSQPHATPGIRPPAIINAIIITKTRGVGIGSGGLNRTVYIEDILDAVEQIEGGFLLKLEEIKRGEHMCATPTTAATTIPDLVMLNYKIRLPFFFVSLVCWSPLLNVTIHSDRHVTIVSMLMLLL
jgi:hypothetical protein